MKRITHIPFLVHNSRFLSPKHALSLPNGSERGPGGEVCLPPCLAGILLMAIVLTSCSGDEPPQVTPRPGTAIPEATSTPVLPPNATGLPPPLGAPLGTTCEVEFPPPGQSKARRPNGADLGIGYDPFCIAWTDVFTNETGFRVELRYGPDPIVYNVPANTNEIYPPPEDWPLAHGMGDVAVTVFAVTPNGNEIVEGFALDVN